ncbi:MAG TPA: lantibiotic dehydratase [Microscillaceae bacterium]|nr:lantibiotic dehydratase [Microscillaceae bacterium]
MTNHKNTNTLEPGSFFVFRTPLLPRTQLRFLADAQLQKNSDSLPVFYQQLLKQYENPDLQQALYLASPDLFHQLERWKKLIEVENPSTKIRKEQNELSRKFLMFLLRAAHRCTPFGTFATVTVGDFKLQRESSLGLEKLSPLFKSSRLDMVYLLRLRAALEAHPQIKAQLRFFPNNTLYKNGDDMLCSYFDEEELQHVASSKSFNEAAWDIFAACREANGMTIDQMVDFVIEPDLTREECLEFIEYLIDHQLLISELYPSLNGDEYLEQLYQTIAQLNNPTHYLQFIEAIRHQLKAIDTTHNATEGLAKYQELLRFLTESKEADQLQLKNDQTKEKELVQVDAFRTLNNQELSKTVARDIVRKIEALCQLPTPKTTPHRDLETFTEAFFKRYEHEAVPLLQVMDEVTGLGYPYGSRVAALTPNLKALKVVFNEDIPIKKETLLPKISVVDEWLHQQYQEALQNNQSQINLTLEDLKTLNQTDHKSEEKMPPAMLAMGKLLFQHSEDLVHDPKNGKPRNFYFYLYHANGPGVGNLLGRFCHGSTTLHDKLKGTIAQLEPDTEEAVYAEIDHLPGQRVGNVILRPKLRNYTIALGGTHTNDPYQIPVADLWLKVTNDRKLMLFSQKLGKIVIPRMSNAHNFSHNAHPLYKFLCDLQYQHAYQHMPAFFNHRHWQAAPYLPRLVYENIILSPQTWKIDQQTLKTVGFQKKEKPNSRLDWQDKIGALQAQLRLPDEVLLVEGDHKLYLHLKSALCVEVLRQKVFKNHKVTLEEVIEAHFPSQAFSNEMIFPILNTQRKNEVAEEKIPTSDLDFQVQKNFSFGSEWVYYKIYLGNLGTDRLIIQHLYPLSKQLKTKGLISQWFFIRYTDGEFGNHLRWRCKLTDVAHFGEVVQFFTQTLLALQKQQVIIHARPDTYQREIGRYLAHNIATSEALFGLDSWFVCHALYLLAIDEQSTMPTANLQLVLALRRIQELFKGLELSDETIQKVIQRGQANFTQEFGFDKHPKRQLLKNSITKDYLEQLIKPALSQDAIAGISPDFQTLINQFTIAQKPILLKVKENLLLNGGNESQMISLASSYIHMFVNRFFSTTQRFQEMWLYQALAAALINKQS